MGRRKLSTFERLQRGEKLNRRELRQVQRQLEAEDPGLEVIYRDVAGIDVGNASHFVSVPGDRDRQPIREFGSWTGALEKMAQWLLQCGIHRVVMQSTGVYWIAVHDVLQRHGLEVSVVDARATKNVPGRKSDVQESFWLRKLETYGLVRRCFLPPPEIQNVRTVWRLRSDHVRDAGRCIQHMQKALIEMNVQVHNALSDLGGVSGQAIIRAILDGERDPKQLADLRDPRCKASEEEVVQSLQGNWKADALFVLKHAVATYDFYQGLIAQCDQELQSYLAVLPTRDLPAEAANPTAATVKKGKRGYRPRDNQPAFDLETELVRILGVNPKIIDGIDVMTIQTVLAEVGPDLSAWKTERHWTSWLNLAPKRDVSGGKVIRHVRQKHTNRAGNAFRMAAQSLVRSQSYLGARYRYLRAKLPGRKAVKAMARYLACLYYRLVTQGQVWVDQGIQEFNRRSQQRELSNLQHRARKLGLQLVPAS